MRARMMWWITIFIVGAVLLMGATWGVFAQTLATFEAGHAFQPEDYVISLTASTDWASEGSRSLKVIHGPIPSGVANRLWIRVLENVNWTGATHVIADFYVPPDAPHHYSAALMVQVGDGWTWYESTPIALSPGENRDIVFRLDTSDWRAAATGWAATATVPLTGLRAWGFLVFSDLSEPGVVYIDNVRLVRPEQAAGGAADKAVRAGSLAQQIQISGSAKLTVVSEPKTVPGAVPMAPIAATPGVWSAAAGTLEIVTVTDMDGNTVQAISVKNLAKGSRIDANLNGADMSAYKYIQLDIMFVSGTGESRGMQFVLEGSPHGYYDTQHFPHVPKGEWKRITLEATHFVRTWEPGTHPDFATVNTLGIRTFDGDADFLIANVYFVGEAGAPEIVQEITRTHEIRVTADVELSPQLSLRVGAILSDPVVRLGIVELKGSDGPLSLRAFHNGKATDLADPLKLFLASKYYEEKASGVDATALVGPATLKVQAVWPSDGDQAKHRVAMAKADLPVGKTANASLIALNQSVPEKESQSAFGAAGKVSLGSVGLTAEIVSAGSEDESAAWMIEASAPLAPKIDVTVHAREYGRNMIPAYNDHASHNGYGQRHIDARWKVSENTTAGLYLQNWYRTDGSWNEILSKLSVDTRLGVVNIATFVETKRLRDSSGFYAFRSGRTSLRASAKLAERFDVLGLVWVDRNQAGDVLPTYLGRLTFEPLSQTVVTLEAAQVKTDPAKEPTENLYAKIARKIPGGELSLAYGKPTLNSNEDAHNNTKTAKDYIEVKLEISF